MSKFSRALTVCSSFVALAAFAGGCSSSSDDGPVKPKLEVINQTKSALSPAAVLSAQGTYGAACTGHASGDPWFVTPSGSDVTVVKNDTACVLTIASISTEDETFVGTPIALDDVWHDGASAFSAVGDQTNALRFYGNAKLDAKTFAADFVISLLVSDDANASSGTNTGSSSEYATRTATLETSAVPASNYSIGFGSFGIAKDINNVVDSVSGYAQLGEEGLDGEDYAIVNGALTGSSTFAAVDSAFAGATQRSISGLTSLRLPAAQFNLATYDLDNSPQRTIIIRHTDQGVSSYQLLLVTFH